MCNIGLGRGSAHAPFARAVKKKKKERGKRVSPYARAVLKEEEGEDSLYLSIYLYIYIYEARSSA